MRLESLPIIVSSNIVSQDEFFPFILVICKHDGKDAKCG